MKTEPMKTASKFLACLAIAISAPVPVKAQSRSQRRPTLNERVERAKAEVNLAAADYKQSLEKLLRLQEGDVLSATSEVERRKSQLAEGVISAKELEAAERSLAWVKSKVLDTRREIAEADLLLTSAVDDKENHHKQPYERQLLLRVLRLNALPESEIREAIEKRGVGFRLTPEDDAAFSSAGASRELLKLMRANYRLH